MSQKRHVNYSKEYHKLEETVADLRHELHYTRLALDDKAAEIDELQKALSEQHKCSSSHHVVSAPPSAGCTAGQRHLERCDGGGGGDEDVDGDGEGHRHHEHQHHHHHEPTPSVADLQEMANLLDHLQLALREKQNALNECQERNRFFCQSITRLQQECHTKDALVVELQNEIDKFRQVVRPLTQVFLQHHKTDCDDINCTIGMESTRVLPSEYRRIKRQGYSAEPLTDLVEAEDKLMKIPKSAK